MNDSSSVESNIPVQAGPGDPARRFGWLRLSLTDVFFFVIIVWLFVADPMGWDRLVWDGDVALHTRIGDYILDHGNVPTQDPFSFTLPGDRWFALQWLSGLVFALLNRWAGLKGILLLCALATGLTYTILLRDMVRRGANGMIALLLTLMAVNASVIHLHARPHLFTILFLVVAHYLIARDRESPSWRIWLLVPLTVLWVNIHSGFPVLLASLGLLAVGTLAGRYTGSKTKAGFVRYGLVLGGCLGATLLNPNGIQLHLHVRQFLSNSWLMQNVSEYKAPGFRSEPEYYYMVLLFAAAAVLWRLAATRRWPDFLWVLVFASGSLMSARHIPLFLVIAVPQIAVALTEVLDSVAAKCSPRSTIAVLGDMSKNLSGRLGPISVWAPAALVAVALIVSAESWPRDLSAKYFPRDMVHRHAPLLAESRVFAPDQWGDYLLWVNYPEQRVFIDGRSDFFSERVARQYVEVGQGSAGWRDVLDEYGVDTILIPPNGALDELLGKDSGWQTVDRDSEAVLYRRSDASTGSGPPVAAALARTK